MKRLIILPRILFTLTLATSCDFGPDFDSSSIREMDSSSEIEEIIAGTECIPSALKENPPTEVIELVEQKREMWTESLVIMSIVSQEDIEQAIIGSPFRDVALERDALFSGSTDIDQLFTVYDAWIFPVLVHGEAVSIVRVLFFEGQWVISSVGSPVLARALGRLGEVIDPKNSTYTLGLVSDFTNVKTGVIATPPNEGCLVYPALILPFEYNGAIVDENVAGEFAFTMEGYLEYCRAFPANS